MPLAGRRAAPGAVLGSLLGAATDHREAVTERPLCRAPVWRAGARSRRPDQRDRRRAGCRDDHGMGGDGVDRAVLQVDEQEIEAGVSQDLDGLDARVARTPRAGPPGVETYIHASK